VFQLEPAQGVADVAIEFFRVIFGDGSPSGTGRTVELEFATVVSDMPVGLLSRLHG
jgi:hypothetical protein